MPSEALVPPRRIEANESSTGLLAYRKSGRGPATALRPWHSRGSDIRYLGGKQAGWGGQGGQGETAGPEKTATRELRFHQAHRTDLLIMSQPEETALMGGHHRLHVFHKQGAASRPRVEHVS